MRGFIVFCCFANIGVSIGLFERVGKYFIPQTGMRLLMVGDAVAIGAIGFANLAHLHSPLLAVSYIVALGVAIKLAALGGLWYWYGTPQGIEHSGRMVQSVLVVRPQKQHAGPDIEKRLRALSLGMLGLYTIALCSVLVIGYFEYVTHNSLCTFRGDLQERVDSGNQLLTASGNGGSIIIVFGVKIPRATIVSQVHSQEQALKSLDGLRCP